MVMHRTTDSRKLLRKYTFVDHPRGPDVWSIDIPAEQVKNEEPGLWASAKGCQVAGSLGTRLKLHDTRRIAAATWAVHDPVNAAGAKDLLGNRSDRVFAQYYNLASGIEASRRIADLVRRR